MERNKPSHDEPTRARSGESVMGFVGGSVFSFPEKSGYIAYSLIVAADRELPGQEFFFAFGSSGVDPTAPGLGTVNEMTGMHFLALSGQSGKLYDNEKNYIFSYDSETELKIDGNIFPDYHNYSIYNVPINLDCARRTGKIDSVFASGVNRNNFSVELRENNSLFD